MKFLIESMFELKLSPNHATSPVIAFMNYVREIWLKETFDKDIRNRFETEGSRETNHLDGWQQNMNGLAKKCIKCLQLAEKRSKPMEVILETTGQTNPF